MKKRHSSSKLGVRLESMHINQPAVVDLKRDIGPLHEHSKSRPKVNSHTQCLERFHLPVKIKEKNFTLSVKSKEVWI